MKKIFKVMCLMLFLSSPFIVEHKAFGDDSTATMVAAPCSETTVNDSARTLEGKVPSSNGASEESKSKEI